MPLGLFLRSAAGTTPPSTSTYVATGTKSPDIAVEIDFDTNPAVLPRNWTDVTPYVRHIQWERGGRAHELQTTSAGTLTGVLDNRDGRFDPTNAGGAYYPNVKRMRWVRVLAKWAGVEYPRWTGLIETWAQDWPSLGKDATCTIRAADAFKILSLFDLVGQSYSEELTGTRVANVCAAVGVPYTVDAGQSTVVAFTAATAGTSALSHLQQVVESENGLLFADATGQIVFQDRHYRLTEATSKTAVDTIGDIAGEIPYRAGTLDYDDANVWPTVIVTPSGGAAQTATDAASITMHFDRVLTRSSLVASEPEALSAAQYLSSLYANPDPRIPQVELIGQAATAKWPTILAMDISQRYTWKRSATAPISQDVIVERISEQAIPPGDGWRITLQLSPASANSYWILGDATFGALDSTNKLGY